MADSVVSLLLDNVAQLLKQEVSLIAGAGDQIRSLQTELLHINEFLRNSSGRREMVKELVGLIRSVAHQAEDVIDTFVINMAKQKRRNKLNKMWHAPEHATMLRGVAQEIIGIRAQISDIYSNRERYGIVQIEAGASDSAEKRRIALNVQRSEVEENEVVGFLNDAKIVMQMLSSGGRQRDVVSIVGMGGLGKTTLAKKVYKDDSVMKRFDCLAWVNVSQEYEARDLLVRILQDVSPLADEDVSKMNDKKLVEELSKFLDDKRYLIVLDDVWTTQVWDGIQKAFPENMSGCRILVTSRIKEVAHHASPISPPYFLPLLGEDDSWNLFSKKAFHGKGCPPELESYARQIALKCGGLPLTIVVVGGLLAKKGNTSSSSSSRTWSQMAKDITWYLDNKGGLCLDVLALSYEDLPPPLKPCFLYLGVFPEDYEFPARQLIRLWVAEGFIEHDDRRDAEDVAEDYLEELIDRSLVMVAKKRTDGGIKSCCIHDMLRDLSIYEGVRENFLTVHTDNQLLISPTNKASITQSRRLSIHCNASKYVSSLFSCDPTRIRSFLCFDGKDDQLGLKFTFRSVYKAFPLLRVLDLGGSTVVLDVPTQLQKLIHLRYLRMNAPHLKEIPVCISSLPNLQTLDLRESQVPYLTANFWHMLQLRHIFLSGDCEVRDLPRTDVSMFNLQTLSTVNIGVLGFRGPSNNLVFPNLKKVNVTVESNYTRYDLSELSKHIRSFKITAAHGFYYDIDYARKINYLTLRKLTLKAVRLKASTLETLEKLAVSVEVLKLYGISLYDTTTMDTKEGGFPKLHTLHLIEMDVREWNLEIGAMPSLRNVVITKCLDLRRIPQQLVSTLHHVKVSWCSSILERNIRNALRDNSNVKLEFQGYKKAAWLS